MKQPALFELEKEAPAEQSPCLSCGSFECFIVEEAATFNDKKGGTPCVSVHWYCNGCGQRSLALREQESPWIRAVWKLPPEPIKSWRRRKKKR